MDAVVTQFLEINGLSSVPPQTIAELIPYCLTVLVDLTFVAGVFRVIGKIVSIFSDFRRW